MHTFEQKCDFIFRQAILRYLAMKYTNYAGYGLNIQQQMLSESVISWCFSEVHRFVAIYLRLVQCTKFEDTKCITRSRKSKDRQHNRQK